MQNGEARQSLCIGVLGTDAVAKMFDCEMNCWHVTQDASWPFDHRW